MEKNIKSYPELMLEIMVKREVNNIMLVVSANQNSYGQVDLSLGIQDGRNIFKDLEDEQRFKEILIDAFMKQEKNNKKEFNRLMKIINEGGWGIFFFRLSISYLILPYLEEMSDEFIDKWNEEMNPMGKNIFRTDTLFYSDKSPYKLIENKKKNIFDAFCG